MGAMALRHQHLEQLGVQAAAPAVGPEDGGPALLELRHAAQHALMSPAASGCVAGTCAAEDAASMLAVANPPGRDACGQFLADGCVFDSKGFAYIILWIRELDIPFQDFGREPPSEV